MTNSNNSIIPVMITEENNDKISYNLQLKNLLHLWLDSKKPYIKGATYLKYKFLIEKHLIPALGDMYITNINSNKLNDFILLKTISEKPLKVSYIKTMICIIKSSINYAVENNYCAPIPLNLKYPKFSLSKTNYIERTQLFVLNEYLLNNPSSIALGIFISLNTGLRIGEICALRWSDIDVENGLLYVNHTISRISKESGSTLIVDTPKTMTSVRQIPLNSSLLLYLNKFTKVENQNFFVLNNTNHFMSPRTFEYKFHQLLKNANVNQFNFHMLRHTFASRCIEFGVDPKTLSEILGHSSVNTTLNIYVHSSLDQKKSQLEKICM